MCASVSKKRSNVRDTAHRGKGYYGCQHTRASRSLTDARIRLMCVIRSCREQWGECKFYFAYPRRRSTPPSSRASGSAVAKALSWTRVRYARFRGERRTGDDCDRGERRKLFNWLSLRVNFAVTFPHAIYMYIRTSRSSYLPVSRTEVTSAARAATGWYIPTRIRAFARNWRLFKLENISSHYLDNF